MDKREFKRGAEEPDGDALANLRRNVFQPPVRMEDHWASAR